MAISDGELKSPVIVGGALSNTLNPECVRLHGPPKAVMEKHIMFIWHMKGIPG